MDRSFIVHLFHGRWFGRFASATPPLPISYHRSIASPLPVQTPLLPPGFFTMATTHNYTTWDSRTFGTRPFHCTYAAARLERVARAGLSNQSGGPTFPISPHTWVTTPFPHTPTTHTFQPPPTPTLWHPLPHWPTCSMPTMPDV